MVVGGIFGGSKSTVVLPDIDKVGIEESLKTYYKAKILPMEKRHDFEHFFSPPLDDAEFNAKPSVLLLGQYSVGKTSMIQYLLGKEYPGGRVGPEPTTDQFMCIMHGENTRVLPGPALVSDEHFPFKSLSKFGQVFLQRLGGAQFNGPLLQHIIFIDTPGILSGEKQRLSRGYDFATVVKFLAEKVDRIFLLFDVSKLDISDEYKVVLQTIQGNVEKIKILLNKADSIEPSELNQVRGALMWNLGKILQSPEVPKVFIGSYWGEPLRNDSQPLKELFVNDYRALLADLSELPRSVKVRKINDLVKRAKLVRLHGLIMDQMLKRMSCTCCSSGIRNIKAATNPTLMATIYKELELKYRVVPSDIPKAAEWRATALTSDFRRWHRLNVPLFEDITSFIEQDVLHFINALPSDAITNTVELQAMQKTVDMLQSALPANLQTDGARAKAGMTPLLVPFNPPTKAQDTPLVKLSAAPELTLPPIPVMPTIPSVSSKGLPATPLNEKTMMQMSAVEDKKEDAEDTTEKEIDSEMDKIKQDEQRRKQLQKEKDEQRKLNKKNKK